MGVNSYIWPLYKTEDSVPPMQIKKDKYNQTDHAPQRVTLLKRTLQK